VLDVTPTITIQARVGIAISAVTGIVEAAGATVSLTEAGIDESCPMPNPSLKARGFRMALPLTD
jgi:hypothetical protein